MLYFITIGTTFNKSRQTLMACSTKSPLESMELGRKCAQENDTLDSVQDAPLPESTVS